MKRRHFLQCFLGLPVAAIVGRAAQATPFPLRAPAREGPLKVIWAQNQKTVQAIRDQNVLLNPAGWAIDVPIGPEGPRSLWRVSWGVLDRSVPAPRGPIGLR